jgi:5,10-methylenetetrahydromethanopterin reductase
MAIGALDHLSDGRALLGIGAGGSGFAEMGVARPKPARAMAEAIDVIRALLRGERVTQQGDVVGFHKGKLDFAPLRADVPVYVASQNALGLRVAGQVADGAIMQGCVNEPMLRFFADEVAAGRQRAGRTVEAVERVARIDVAIADDRRAALDAVRPNVAVTLLFQKPTFASFVQAGLEIPHDLLDLIAEIPPTRDPAVTRPIAAHIPDAWVEAFIIAGDAGSVAQQVTDVLRHDIDHFLLRPVAIGGDRIEPLRRFAQEVLPRVRSQLEESR